VTSATASTPPASLSTHLKTLFAHSAIYGSQDAAAQVINLALTPLYVAILTPTEVGVIVILFTFSTVAKVVFRLGLDSGFFRIYYDLQSDEERASLAGTVARGVGPAQCLGGNSGRRSEKHSTGQCIADQVSGEFIFGAAEHDRAAVGRSPSRRVQYRGAGR